MPKEIRLHQNYPNPFNPTTTIAFELPLRADATLSVFDVTGRRVGRFDAGILPAGVHRIMFNAEGLASGTYFYRLQAGDYVETKRMVVVR